MYQVSLCVVSDHPPTESQSYVQMVLRAHFERIDVDALCTSGRTLEPIYVLTGVCDDAHTVALMTYVTENLAADVRTFTMHYQER